MTELTPPERLGVAHTFGLHQFHALCPKCRRGVRTRSSSSTAASRQDSATTTAAPEPPAGAASTHTTTTRKEGSEG